MANFGPLTAEISLVIWGTPANFKGLHMVTGQLADMPTRGLDISRTGQLAD